MKERNYYNYTDHTTYGGQLSLFDFEGHHNLQTMANKIASELKFDKRCKQNIESRKKQQKERN